MTLPDSGHASAVAAVTSTWQGRADSYDLFYRRHADRARGPWRELYRTAVTDLLGPGRQRVLDVGTGTGFGAVLLAELGHDVTGIDAAPRMLEYAADEARRRRVSVRWRHGDAHDPAITGVDLVTCRYVLWTLPDPAAALRSWARLLRPGGAVLVADSRWHTTGQLLRHPSRVPGAIRDYRSMGRALPLWRGVTASQTARLLRDAGFGEPRPYEHLLPAAQRDSNHFFVAGATVESAAGATVESVAGATVESAAGETNSTEREDPT